MKLLCYVLWCFLLISFCYAQENQSFYTDSIAQDSLTGKTEIVANPRQDLDNEKEKLDAMYKKQWNYFTAYLFILGAFLIIVILLVGFMIFINSKKDQE